MGTAELVKYLAQCLVDEPEHVEVEEAKGERSSVIRLRVADEDVGKVIGRRGRIVRAIRVVAKAAAAREGIRVDVEIAE